METAGIVAEYNPFHNGHAWQLKELKKQLGDVSVVACMSGAFVQRGEAAIASPLVRAEMAIRGGIDLVLELPVAYSLRSADYFAAGAVQTLAATGLVTHLVCGIENPVTEDIFLSKIPHRDRGKNLNRRRMKVRGRNRSRALNRA